MTVLISTREFIQIILDREKISDPPIPDELHDDDQSQSHALKREARF